MELGTNFAAKLEPFLLISKSAKGAAAAKLIRDATSAPGVFVFAELLELPNIQELANNEQHAPFLSLLQIFSYRTYREYLENKDSLPPLNQAQTTKLRYLTVVTLAAERRILPYYLLLQELKVESIRELEDLIIDAIYLDILRGKLDQKEQQFEIEYTMGRDLEPGKLECVLVALHNWATTTASVLAELDQKLTEAATHNAMVHADNEEHERIYVANLKEAQERQKDTKGGRRTAPFGSSNADNMDVDDPCLDGPKIRNRKAPTDSMVKLQQRKRNRF
ncbi:hypothetical protein PAXRUDRAFT_822995 [Paxillus rubicundulus Ve08.2h10]|uniref:PCI domain-containing protein n=1 Tax=Paxillus rubicundulus Ve08.2h10 TaxID=930991 RepID=A0A0D0DKZ6_9AGAM|nr:hypothetical protein PAXRUDRAFT_822995 [Paxillus rubicundulus Ve08.2h10]